MQQHGTMFKQIERHPKYIVSDTGAVYRKLPGNGMTYLYPDYSNGYARVDLDGVKESIGRLVLETFNPPRDLSQRVFYIDGDTRNNNLDNLVWLTPSEVQLYSQYTVEYRREKLNRGAR